MLYRKSILLIFTLVVISGCAATSGITLYDPSFQLPPGYTKNHKLVNEKVIFLPMYLSTQHYGYQSYYFHENKPFNHPRYKDLFRKTAEIIGYREGMFPYAILKVNGLNWILFTHVTLNSLNNVGFISEMENAKQYLGKTVWNKAHPTDNSADRHGYIRCARKVGKFEDVKFIDIQWSPNETSPLRFIFKTKDGLKGYWDGTFSRINDSESHLAQPFAENWYFKDPHIIHSDWPQRAWDAIENEKIFLGMTKEQAILSWGKPRKINKIVGAWGVHEQWVYGSQYLYFENGKLTSFQND